MARHAAVKVMSAKRPSKRFWKATQSIRDRITALDYICQGSVAARMKRCGSPNCRCAEDPKAWHGPYHIWSRHEGGRLLQTTLTKETAAEMAAAVTNYRTLEALIAAWIRETRRDLLDRDET